MQRAKARVGWGSRHLNSGFSLVKILLAGFPLLHPIDIEFHMETDSVPSSYGSQSMDMMDFVNLACHESLYPTLQLSVHRMPMSWLPVRFVCALRFELLAVLLQQRL